MSTEAARIVSALRGRKGVCFCPAHDNHRTPALSVRQGEDGKLLLHCFAGCDFAAIMNALRGLGLIEDRASDYRPPSRADLAKIRQAERAEADKKARQAKQIWDEARPITGTIAQTYLREARGTTAALPESLRFHPETWHGPTARRLPAMVARLDEVFLPAVPRTFLRPDGSGKAEVEPNKMMLGAVAGGHVELARADGPLVVCEGIETGLALASGLLRAPATIWASLSTSGMRGLDLPPSPGRLTIATDGDQPGRTAGHALAERASMLGWTVSILPAPDGRDWADILQMRGASA